MTKLNNSETDRKSSEQAVKWQDHQSYNAKQIGDWPDRKGEGGTSRFCLFTDVHFRKKPLSGVDFSHSVFVRCSFRELRLEEVRFLDCRFIDCEFRRVTLINCRLEYSKWNNTHIEPGQVIENLPPWPNVARDLLQNLRSNATHMGDAHAARDYLHWEMKNARKHLWRKMFSTTDYYKKKYEFLERLYTFPKYTLNNIDRFFWGYGEKPFRLFVPTILYILFSTILKGFVSQIPFISGLASTLNIMVGGLDAGMPVVHPCIYFMDKIAALMFFGLLVAGLYRRVSLRQSK